ncbi:MAG: hypothetical protein ABL874_02245 [Sphingopyxis sp.]
MSDPIFIAFVGFIAAIGGGVIQAWANRNFEEVKFGREARNDAYTAYEKGVSQLSFATTEEAKDSAHALIAEARSRIALFGSPRVVSAMSKAFRRGSDLHSDGAWQDHAEMIAAMRVDIDPKAEKAEPRDLFELVYGSEPKIVLK